MATMVKEKRREKKKCKDRVSKNMPISETPTIATLPASIVEEGTKELAIETATTSEITKTPKQDGLSETKLEQIQEHSESNIEHIQDYGSTNKVSLVSGVQSDYPTMNFDTAPVKMQNTETINIPLQITQEMEHLSDVSLGSEANEFVQNTDISHPHVSLEDVAPSAPMLEDEHPHIMPVQEIPVVNEVIRLKSMPLEEAVRQFAGAEIAEVMAMSEREEALVDAGPTSGPEHPLVDLLSTFRRSLIAVERERTQMETGYADEEKFRSTLWRITKKTVQATEKCQCGLNVNFKATYDHAEFQKERLPIARLKLEGLLKEVQESFCHNQHEALLAHYQIEEFISEVVKSHKNEIREALTLVLHALKLCDSAPAVLGGALQRWARALAAALVDQRDVRQLLFLMHHLFRQTRSVRWAAQTVSVTVTDSVSAARAIALMDLLFARTKIDAAVECVEEKEEAWEEVDKDGGAGAVSEGRLRERDLLAVLAALPLRDLVATVLRLRPVTGQPRCYKWEETDARGVVRACGGVRALLHTITRAVATHARYTRLVRALRNIARNVMGALAALHEHAWTSYPPEMESKVLGELQAVFVSGLQVMDGVLQDVPASLLAAHTARDYCLANMIAVDMHRHDYAPRVESLSLELSGAPCADRVRAVSQAAVSRRQDYELARMVVDFLFRVGVKKSALPPCKGGCRQAARGSLPAVLAAHPYLHALALHLVAETSPVEKLDAASTECLCVGQWRPAGGEARAVLAAWAARCPHLLPALVLQADCAPHSGISLESQLTIGAWLCEHVATLPEPEDWCWRAIRRLRLHATYWGLAVEPPPPDPRPAGLYAQAFALAASSWGHSIPLICSKGVEALCALATTRVQDALHCLSPIMLVLAHSPESVSTTPRFKDLFSMLISAGPGLMQRALGRGGSAGADCLLRLMMDQLQNEHCGGVSREALAGVWVAALWPVPGACALLDTAMLTAPRSPLDRHTACLAASQDEESQQQLLAATKWSSQAALLCESALRAWHSEREVRTRLHPRLLDALHAQRVASQRIHVDNALKFLGVSLSSDQLTIYGAAAAALTAPPAHPANLSLWRLLMHLYLHRAPSYGTDSPPIGPLFFSGLIKSRTFTQLKRRLLKVIQHHGAEATSLKSKQTKSDPPPTRPPRSKTPAADNSLTVPLSIHDLTGESSESSDVDTDVSDGQKEDSEPEDLVEEDSVIAQLLKYHIGAERMFCEYLRWLDEGDKTKAMPHHAEIANFIPEQALQAAQRAEAVRRRPVLSPDCEPPPLPPGAAPPPVPSPPTPLNDATQALMSIRGLRRRFRRRSVRSPLRDVDCRDARAMLALVDKHLADIQKLSQEWCKEVNRVESLDTALWPLTMGWRVARPMPALHATCANKCRPVGHTPQNQQWCISLGAEQGIKDNRSSARAAVRQLARSRPHAARAAAVLLAVARRAGSFEMARRIAERVFQCAGNVSKSCAPAAAALASVVELIAERWLLSDGSCCAALVSRWGGPRSSELQRSLCLCLVSPARGAAAHVPALHGALLAAGMPAQMVFSALSKFDLARWSHSVDSTARAAILESLTAAAQRWGPTPSSDDMLLVELLGVQMSAACHSSELCVLLRACTRACIDKKLPPPILEHVLRAADKCATSIPYDQLGHMLRELGVTWWEARTKLPEANAGSYAAYAQNTLALLLALHLAFYHAAVALSYTPEKVGLLSWASLQEALSAWIAPSAPPALPPALLPDYAAALQHVFGHLLHHYSGIIHVLLNQIFEWVLQTYQLARGSTQGRLQVSTLLASCCELPWDKHQWLLPSGLQAMLQVSQCNDQEMLSWCSRCCEGLEVGAWLRGEEGEPAARLAALLYLWTGTTMPCSAQTVEKACRLPWQRLPEAALDEALDRFFQLHYGLATPYHHLPQFKILLAACELLPVDGTVGNSSVSRQKRARGVSQWTRALHEHRAPAPSELTVTIGSSAPHLLRLEGGEAELVDLIGRALAIFCIEPTAAVALPFWERFISSSDASVLRAILQAVGGLTAFEYFAPLADVAVRTHLAQGGDWNTVVRLWQGCVWKDAVSLSGRGRLHASYAAHASAPSLALRACFIALQDKDIHAAACGRTPSVCPGAAGCTRRTPRTRQRQAWLCAPASSRCRTRIYTRESSILDHNTVVRLWRGCVWKDAVSLSGRGRLHASYAAHAAAPSLALRACFIALQDKDIHAKNNEAIISLWICVACRVARCCTGNGEDAECRNAALALLARWGDTPRGLLRLVLPSAGGPTPQHRLLCLFAQCVLSPNNDSVIRAYESSCGTVSGSSPDVAAWGRSPHPKRLPRLAMRLFPNQEKYFQRELELAPEDG